MHIPATCVYIESDAPSSSSTHVERTIVEADNSSKVQRSDDGVQEVGSAEEAAHNFKYSSYCDIGEWAWSGNETNVGVARLLKRSVAQELRCTLHTKLQVSIMNYVMT
ncbi:hypothetical protein EMCRGX_G011256 [Ephydatia muelleri]